MKNASNKQKEVIILARAQYKNNEKAVLYRVLSSNGVDTYITTVYAGVATSCTCPATRKCYHMQQVQKREWEHARRDAARTANNYYELAMGI